MRASKRVASITLPVQILEVAINTTSAALAWSRAFQGREARRGARPRPTSAPGLSHSCSTACIPTSTNSPCKFATGYTVIISKARCKPIGQWNNFKVM